LKPLRPHRAQHVARDRPRRVVPGDLVEERVALDERLLLSLLARDDDHEARLRPERLLRRRVVDAEVAGVARLLDLPRLLGLEGADPEPPPAEELDEVAELDDRLRRAVVERELLEVEPELRPVLAV